MKYFYTFFILGFIFCGTMISCKDNNSQKKGPVKETLTSGSITLLTDNTVQPIVEDVLAVFHNIYDRANIKQVNKTEQEIIQAMMQDSATIAVLPRMLTKDEEAHFAKKDIKPRVTPFAVDAIALITNEKATDSVINLEEVLKVLQGKPSGKIKTLVFDNSGSSTVQYLLKLAGVKTPPSSGVYALNTNEEVIKYVYKNNGAIGIVGVNWLVQPPAALTQYIDKITVLGVDNVKIDRTQKKYYKPNQSNIADGSYPLTRKLYVLNYQGRQGLGMGFATYISARDGQRIILKSGLLPIDIPTREIAVRKEL
jgi:phosphate transport system substrate-binding protein